MLFRSVCFGSEEELLELSRKIAKDAEDNRWPEVEQAQDRLSSFDVRSSDSFDGKSIRDSRLREDRKVLVVGVERGSERTLGPSSEFVLKNGDLVWVVSE